MDVDGWGNAVKKASGISRDPDFSISIQLL